jgi:hypothetical protein
MTYRVADAHLRVSFNLPNGATSTTSAGINLELTHRSDFVAEHEVELAAPALSAAELPDNQTMSYAVEHDGSANFSTATVLIPRVAVQTGTGGAGAAAQTVRFKLPNHVKRHVRVRATNSGTGNASSKQATVRILT